MLDAFVVQLRAAIRARLDDAERKQRFALEAQDAFGKKSRVVRALRRDALRDIAVAAQMIQIVSMLEDPPVEAA